jgi:hypothetical protein
VLRNPLITTNRKVRHSAGFCYSNSPDRTTKLNSASALLEIPPVRSRYLTVLMRFFEPLDVAIGNWEPDTLRNSLTSSREPIRDAQDAKDVSYMTPFFLLRQVPHPSPSAGRMGS